MQKIKLSVVVNTINEEKNIERCLRSVNKIADEIVVVDMHSTDLTTSIAKKMGATVYQHERTGYIEPARNYAIEKAKGEWILILDADEIVSEGLAKEIKKIINNNNSGDYFRIPRKNIIFDKWMRYSRWWPDYNIRLFRKGSVTWDKEIHSVPITNGKGIELEALEDLAIEHFHYQTVEQYLEKLNNYTSHQARLRYDDGYKFDWKDLVSKPTAEFVSRYFFGQGYKDNVHGLGLALLQAFSEVVVYLKIWQLTGFSKNKIKLSEVVGEINLSQKEMNYWKADALVKDSGGIKNRIKRKFKLQ